ncbi:MAG: hypothetical protein IPO21_21170 [Bacteroidales bacterium]|nr:hypothetical protein [Bacteroidales bacterium]
MVNIYFVLKIVKNILLIIAAAMLLCVFVALIYSEPIYYFITNAIITFSISIFIHLFTRHLSKEKAIHKRDAIIAVVFLG